MGRDRHYQHPFCPYHVAKTILGMHQRRELNPGKIEAILPGLGDGPGEIFLVYPERDRNTFFREEIGEGGAPAAGSDHAYWFYLPALPGPLTHPRPSSVPC